MSIHFHALLVKEIRQETPECVSVVFAIPEPLQDRFNFMQGQSLTMRARINDREVRRTYSICSSPLENEVRVAVKKVEGGLFSQFINDRLKVGDMLEVMEPVGKFNTRLHPGQKKNYLAIAAGSGITPVISLIKATLATEPESHFTLLYGNRTKSSIIFFEELEAIKNKFLHRFSLVNILSRERTDAAINNGRINIEKLKELSKVIDYAITDEVFICGPQEMIFLAKEFLEQKGIDRKNIHFELFTTPGENQPTSEINPFANNDPEIRKQKPVSSEAESKVTIRLDGRSFDFPLGFDDEPILDAALKLGADLPYACKGGVCCTCKAKLLEGEVQMDVHWGLEDEEIQQGYILTCQSHPKTARVVIDFDVK